jgi:hypothetical protein
MRATLVLLFTLFAVQTAAAGMSCVKPDGDWLDGVSKRECLGPDVRGSWESTSTPLDKPVRKVKKKIRARR